MSKQDIRAGERERRQFRDLPVCSLPESHRAHRMGRGLIYVNYAYQQGYPASELEWIEAFSAAVGKNESQS